MTYAGKSEKRKKESQHFIFGSLGMRHRISNKKCKGGITDRVVYRRFGGEFIEENVVSLFIKLQIKTK